MRSSLKHKYKTNERQSTDASVRGLQATCVQTKKRENREFQSGPRFIPFLYILRDDVTHGDVLLDATTDLIYPLI